MTYRQITFAERYTLGLLRQGGLAPAAIARVLGRHRSTIGREVRRNGTPRDGCYRPQLAEWYARGRRARSRRNRRFSAADWARMQTLVREDWSPEQIAGRLRRHRELAISHETIYRYLWADKHAGGTLYRHLRGARKQRRKRYGRYDSRGRVAGKRFGVSRSVAMKLTGHKTESVYRRYAIVAEQDLRAGVAKLARLHGGTMGGQSASGGA